LLRTVGRQEALQTIGWLAAGVAVLLAIVLTSAATLTPTYCGGLCPFKTVTEFEAVTSPLIMVQTGIFLSLFAALVVMLPLLSKRRTQCGLFCPMGAFQSFANKLSIFDIRIDRAKCTGSGRCEGTCPTFSLYSRTIKKGKTRLTCTRCGKCVDECPRGAISCHVKGTPVGAARQLSRVLFLYPAFLLLQAASPHGPRESRQESSFGTFLPTPTPWSRQPCCLDQTSSPIVLLSQAGAISHSCCSTQFDSSFFDTVSDTMAMDYSLPSLTSATKQRFLTLTQIGQKPQEK
jgi:ferredoxin